MVLTNFTKFTKFTKLTQKNRKFNKKIPEYTLKFFAMFSSSIIFAIVIFLVYNTAPLITEINLLDFLLGNRWYPSKELYGILPMIIGTIITSFIALAIAVPLGVGCAIFLSEIIPNSISKVFRSSIEILATIPSVVYGFIGMILLIPLIRDIFGGTGFSALSGGIILSIMILPTIVSLSEDALRTVPSALKDGSLALGATRFQTLKNITLPSALSGIISSIILGLGRAVGETMAVIMVVGNWALIPTSPLEPVRTLTSHIVLNIKETATGGVIYHVMFATGLVLLIVVMALNLIAKYVNSKYNLNN
ncbi:phosphate ABC transporter permease subunit PstC [Methanococcus voltae]|uniref:Phosphate transport system permease protein n=1 Tax=Methanococcus voltae (strain ATCC BAA-1334 / A3) TaxID=456320 RepID=D7DSZ2_METV3|nr:phosphate ABC transporter permease subunit PstC [Methanococcus voltae]MCS3901857.1 phosphate transport system permease protein [Methanococcus voltae]